MIRGRHYRGGYQSAGLTDSARELRKKGTSAESLLWQHLRNRKLHGFKFRRQHQFGDYIADFFCYEARLVVECDGRVHEANEQWNHDQNRETYMVELGLRVVRFTNEEVLDHIERVIDRIATYLPSPSGRRAREEGLADEIGSISSREVA